MQRDFRRIQSVLMSAILSTFALLTPGSFGACIPQWIASAGSAGTNGEVRAFIQWTPPGSSKTYLVVGGTFSSAGNQPNTGGIATWDGSHWASLGGGVAGRVDALLVLNGKLYAGGLFSSAGGLPVSNFAMWDGASWHALGNIGPNAEVFALAADGQNQVWVGGWFSAVGNYTMHNIAIWNTTNSFWSTTLNGMSGQVNALAYYNGHIVAAGAFGLADGVPATNIAYFVNNVGWHAMGPGLGNEVTSLLVSGGTLYAGGYFLATGNGATGASHIARWNGSSWSALGQGLNATVWGMYIYNASELVAVGDFTGTGSTGTLSHIAVFNGTSWLPLGAGLAGGSARGIGGYGSEMYVGGGFVTAGGAASPHIATWTTPDTVWVSEQPKPVNTTPGSSANFSAFIAMGYPGTSYHWRRNGIPVNNGVGGASPGGGTVSGASGIVGVSGSVTLTIGSVKTGDAGTYDVAFVGGCSSPLSTGAALTVSAGCSGDLNHDSQVDDADFSLFVGAYNILDCADPLMPAGCGADLNHDGFVDDSDFTKFVTAYDALICP